MRMERNFGETAPYTVGIEEEYLTSVRGERVALQFEHLGCHICSRAPPKLIFDVCDDCGTVSTCSIYLPLIGVRPATL